MKLETVSIYHPLIGLHYNDAHSQVHVFKMKPVLPLIVLSVTVNIANAAPLLGEICHADAAQSKFNFPGLWEKNEQNEWICNYRQFISEEDWLASQIDDEELIDELEDDSDDESEAEEDIFDSETEDDLEMFEAENDVIDELAEEPEAEDE